MAGPLLRHPPPPQPPDQPTRPAPGDPLDHPVGRLPRPRLGWRARPDRPLARLSTPRRPYHHKSRHETCSSDPELWVMVSSQGRGVGAVVTSARGAALPQGPSPVAQPMFAPRSGGGPMVGVIEGFSPAEGGAFSDVCRFKKWCTSTEPTRFGVSPVHSDG